MRLFLVNDVLILFLEHCWCKSNRLYTNIHNFFGINWHSNMYFCQWLTRLPVYLFLLPPRNRSPEPWSCPLSQRPSVQDLLPPINLCLYNFKRHSSCENIIIRISITNMNHGRRVSLWSWTRPATSHQWRHRSIMRNARWFILSLKRTHRNVYSFRLITISSPHGVMFRHISFLVISVIVL